MTEAIYNIVLKTLIGDKYGKMITRTSNGKIEGIISILNHSEPFCGIIKPDGNCDIKGKIVTLLNTLNFIGTGNINKHFISLNIFSDNNEFKITGTLDAGKGDLA